MKNIVLDTNVLLVSISSKSRLHWIFEELLRGSYILCVTTGILAEYAEIIERHMGAEASQSVLATLETLPNITFVNRYFKFDLLKDKDDNKFVDCAINASASFIVSHDRDFDMLKDIPFPKVRVINTDELAVELGISNF